MSCRINRQRVWTSKLIMESMYHAPQSNWFITLTYDDEHAPVGPDGQLTLVRQHGVAFRKRMRTELEQSTQSFRFFFVGEYGGKTQRPHYHMLAFGLPMLRRSPRSSSIGASGDQVASSRQPGRSGIEVLNVEALVQSKWPHGFVSVAPVTKARMAYCAHYCTKKLTSSADIRLGSRHPEFSQMSRRPALGDAFVQTIAQGLNRPHSHVELTGDVPFQYRYEGQVWPFSQRHKRLMRKLVGLPEKRMDIVALHPELQEEHRELSAAPELEELLNRRGREKQYEAKAQIFRRNSV